MKISKINSILSLVPNAEVTVLGDGSVQWHSPKIAPVTDTEIDAEIVRLQAEYDAQEYARNRQAEYPDWGTQLNKIYDDGIAKWKSEMVDPIKAKYPKP